MKRSTVIAIIVVIAALIAVSTIQNIIKNRQRATPGEQFVRILPRDMRAADIHKIEVYGGDARKDAIILARSEDGWNVPSRFNSKGNETNVNDLLDSIKKLEGELRTNKESLHGDYDITDKEAVHIALYTKGDKLYGDLLLGKRGERYDEGFVRLADSNSVYLATKNLRGTLGVYGEDDKPDPKKWLDLTITDRKSEEIAKVALDMPGKQVVLEKREKKKPEEEEKPEEEKPPLPGQKPEERKEYEWVLVEPKVEFKLQESAVKSLVSSLSQLKGEDVADPAKMEEYGLTAPTYTATFTMDDETTESILVGTKTEEDNKRYATLKDGTTVYIVPEYTINGVFKKMRELVDIKIWDLKNEDIASLSLHIPEYEILLRPREGTEGKESKDWVLAKPETRFKLKDYRVTTILSRVTKPSPQDLFVGDDLQAYGLDDPQLKAVVTMKDDSTHILTFGKNVPDGEDRYVKFEGKDHVYSFTKWNFQDLFQKLPKLLTIDIMEDLTKDEIVGLTYDTADEDFVLSRAEDVPPGRDKKKWSVKTDEEEAEAKSAAIDDILSALTGVEPEDMAIALSEGDCGLDKPSETLTISAEETADRYTLLFGKEVSEETGDRYFKIKGQPEIFVLSKANFDKIFRKLEDLKVEKPVEPEEQKKPPAEEEKPPTEEKPAPSEEEPKVAPEKKDEGEPIAPEKKEPPAPKPEGEKGKEKEPSSEKEKPAPQPSGEKPPPPKAEEELPTPPLPKLPPPKKPLPLPPKPEKGDSDKQE